MEATENKKIITKKDLNMLLFKWLWIAEWSNSFERLQTLSFCVVMIPILKKLYPNKEDLIPALQRHLEFFNTEAVWGSIIHGIVVSMEEQKALGADIPDSAIIGIKSGLIGPFAGIGDTIDWGTLRTLILAIMIPFAADGAWWPAIAQILIFTAIIYIEGYFMMNTGYKLGSQSAINILQGGFIKKLIAGSSVMGLFMMGALGNNFVAVYTPIWWCVNGNLYIVQTGILDGIAPGLLSLGTILLCYWHINKTGKVHITTYWLILIALVLGIVGVISKTSPDEAAITAQLVEEGRMEAPAEE